MRGPLITAADRHRALQCFRDGWSYSAIARELDRPRGTISGLLSIAILRGEIPRRRQWLEGRRTVDYRR
jgi:IS30 family transposase